MLQIYKDMRVEADSISVVPMEFHEVVFYGIPGSNHSRVKK